MITNIFLLTTLFGMTVLAGLQHRRMLALERKLRDANRDKDSLLKLWLSG